ncbi:MCE family protein [Actinocorallia populi]|uniref:MCE family protein n=1 Tax=Actinocorallia populi TaxID=2079200 RepID=UPI000D089A65|nr:MCE family protein [Actinocorallia populi]
MTAPRTFLAAALSGALMLGLGGCGVVGEDGGYPVVVYFEKTPALYEASRVKVMGSNVGVVEDLRIEDDKVRVRLRVDSGVPLPSGVRATIAAESAIGERSVILFPAWRPGDGREKPGAVIPIERTEPAVEIDEALTAFTDLAESVDPAKVSRLVGTGADLVEGRGDSINRALSTTSELADDLAAQDERLVSVAEGLRDLSSSLNDRDEKLRRLIDSFATVSGQLADERTRLKNFLVGLETLIRTGDVVIRAYREKLPTTLVKTSTLVMTLKANSASLAKTITGLARFTDLAVSTWDRENDVSAIRIQLNATMRIWLQPIFDAMNWGEVPCLERPIGNCAGETVERGGS